MVQAEPGCSWAALRPHGREMAVGTSEAGEGRPRAALPALGDPSPEHSGEELTGVDADAGEGSPQAPEPQHGQG